MTDVERITAKSYVELDSSTGHQAIISQTPSWGFSSRDMHSPVRIPMEEYILHRYYSRVALYFYFR